MLLTASYHYYVAMEYFYVIFDYFLKFLPLGLISLLFILAEGFGRDWSCSVNSVSESV